MKEGKAAWSSEGVGPHCTSPPRLPATMSALHLWCTRAGRGEERLPLSRSLSVINVVVIIIINHHQPPSFQTLSPLTQCHPIAPALQKVTLTRCFLQNLCHMAKSIRTPTLSIVCWHIGSYNSLHSFGKFFNRILEPGCLPPWALLMLATDVLASSRLRSGLYAGLSFTTSDLETFP